MFENSVNGLSKQTLALASQLAEKSPSVILRKLAYRLRAGVASIIQIQIWGLKSLKAHQQTACCDINTFYEVHYEVTVHFRAIYVFTMKLAVGCMALLTRARCGFGLIKAIVGNGKTTRRKTQKTTKRDRTSAPNHRKEAKLTLL